MTRSDWSAHKNAGNGCDGTRGRWLTRLVQDQSAVVCELEATVEALRRENARLLALSREGRFCERCGRGGGY